MIIGTACATVIMIIDMVLYITRAIRMESAIEIKRTPQIDREIQLKTGGVAPL